MVNPYAPPKVPYADGDATLAVSFQLTQRQIRHSIDQYLLHWHSIRLIVGSILMIFVSTVIMIVATSQGVLSLFMALALSIAVSAAVYIALVFKTRDKLKQQLLRYGIVPGANIQLQLSTNSLDATIGNDEHQWPLQQLEVYRTRNGILLCPEALLPIYVPKKADFDAGDFRLFRRLALARSEAQ